MDTIHICISICYTHSNWFHLKTATRRLSYSCQEDKLYQLKVESGLARRRGKDQASLVAQKLSDLLQGPPQVAF